MELTSKFIEVNNRQLHYLAAGSGEPILCLHGWPTSSHLWRNIMPSLAQTYQVIALDLPGFGQSSKLPNDSYSFRYYLEILDGFLDALEITQLSLMVHDLGGPIGLLWAVRNPERIKRLVLFNTLVYPNVSGMVKLFVASTMIPGVRHWLSSPRGITWALRFGVENKANLTPKVLEPYLAPFKPSDARRALLKTAQRLSSKGFQEITEKLPNLDIPVRLIYGENDRILPKVATTMARVQQDLPQATLTALPNCGHFLQEDVPEQISQLLSEFFAG